MRKKYEYQSSTGEKFTLVDPSVEVYLEYLDYIKSTEKTIEHALFIVSKCCEEFEGIDIKQIARDYSAVDIINMSDIIYKTFEKKS